MRKHYEDDDESLDTLFSIMGSQDQVPLHDDSQSQYNGSHLRELRKMLAAKDESTSNAPQKVVLPTTLVVDEVRVSYQSAEMPTGPLYTIKELVRTGYHKAIAIIGRQSEQMRTVVGVSVGALAVAGVIGNIYKNRQQ